MNGVEVPRRKYRWRIAHVVALVLAYVPPPIFRGLIHLSAWCVRLIFPRKRRKLEAFYRSLNATLGVTTENPAAHKLAREHFYANLLLKFAHGYLALAPMRYAEQLLKVSGFEAVQSAITTYGAVVLCGIHSQWSHLAAAYAVRHDIPICILRHPEKRFVRHRLHKQLLFYGAEPIFVTAEMPYAAILKLLLENVRGGKSAFVYLDGIYGERQYEVQVDGKVLHLRAGLLEVARLARIPVVQCIAAVRGPHLQLHFFAPSILATQEDVEKFLARVAHSYHEYCRTYPACLPVNKLEKSYWVGR